MDEVRLGHVFRRRRGDFLIDESRTSDPGGLPHIRGVRTDSYRRAMLADRSSCSGNVRTLDEHANDRTPALLTDVCPRRVFLRGTSRTACAASASTHGASVEHPPARVKSIDFIITHRYIRVQNRAIESGARGEAGSCRY